jgi:hypothetical protein
VELCDGLIRCQPCRVLKNTRDIGSAFDGHPWKLPLPGNISVYGSISNVVSSAGKSRSPSSTTKSAPG